MKKYKEKALFTLKDGSKVEITRSDIHCYRADDNCVFYMKDGSEFRVIESFEEVDKIFDL